MPAEKQSTIQVVRNFDKNTLSLETMETNQVCDEAQRIAGVCFTRDELPLTGPFTQIWTKRQNPVWHPRRASVATCQQQQQHHLLAQHYGYKTTYQFNLTGANIEDLISQKRIQHNQQEQQKAQQRKQVIFNHNEGTHGVRTTREPEDQDIKSNRQCEKDPRGAAIRLTTSERDDEQKGMPTIVSAIGSSLHETAENGDANMARRRLSLTSSKSIEVSNTSAISDQRESSNELLPESGTKKYESARELRGNCATPPETEWLGRAVSKCDAKSSVNQSVSSNLVATRFTTCCSDSATEMAATSPPECEQDCPLPYKLTSENMNEKLQMQDRQRKHVILSMAVKQMMTEQSDSDSDEKNPAPIDQDCCHCCCRSRSFSIGSTRDSVQASASLTPSIQADRATLVDSQSVFGEAVRALDANESLDVDDKHPPRGEDSFVDIIPMSKRRYSGAFESGKLAVSQQEDRNIFRPQVSAKQTYQHQARNSNGEDLVSKLNSMRQLVEGKNSLECADYAHDVNQWRNHPLQADEREYGADCFENESRPGSTLDQWHKTSGARKETARRSCSALGKSNTGCMQSPGYNLNEHNDLEALIVESWLDDHPNFTRDYIMRKATRQVVDDWLVANAIVSNTNLSGQADLRSSINSISRPVSQISLGVYLRDPSWKGSQLIGNGPDLGEYDSQCPIPAGSMRANRSNSQSASVTNRAHGFVTPIRKISATDFQTRTGTGYLRPMLSKTPDGRLTFLPQASRIIAREQVDMLHETVVSEKHESHRSNIETPRVSDTSRANSIENKARATERLIGKSSQATIDSVVGDSEETNQVDDLAEDDSEVKLIFELVKNIYDDLDIRTLLYKILKNIAVLINADRSSLFLVCGGPNDPNRRLVSQLFNVDQDSIDVGEPEESITIPWGTGLVGYVAKSGEAVNITNCYDDPRFTDAVDQRTGYLTKHMLCAPIFDKRNEIVGVAQVINKRDGNAFSKGDELKFIRYLQFCGIALRNAQSYEHCQLENRRNQVLLDLARMVFEEQSTIEQVVYRIMLHTQSLLDCERCQVLLIDDGNDQLENLHKISSYRNSAFQTNEMSALKQAEKFSLYGGQVKSDDDKEQDANDCTEPEPYQQPSPKLFSLVFDLECDGNDPVIHKSKDEADSKSCAPKTSRAFPVNIGITGYVAMTGETLNIENAHQHDRFDVCVDEGSDFKHKSILCMPIRNGQRHIIGVIQLVNKKNGQPFNMNDEDLFEAFAIFCGLGIHNTLMYERVLKVMAKQRVTFEVLSYHATAPLEEAKKLAQEQIPSCYALNLASLKFNDFSLNEQYMLKSCLRFFLDLDLIRRFQIDQLVFCNWILSVQKNYRKVTYHPIVGGNGLKASPVRYHNWRHAFNVSQMMFAILVNTQVCQALGELETLALLIACLCHDLDHRGTNNSFQIKSASPLAELYSTSTMEHHHFDQCVMILNSQGNQILSNLSPEEYSKVIILLEEAILATDLANYFRNRDRFFQLINSNKFDWHNDPGHRSLMRCMLMTACDVAAITKPWPVQKVVADLVMSEFYQQGDIEKTELKIEPIDMMNRDKMSQLPTMQISFIDNICAPIYTAFAKLFPVELTTLLDGCLSNRNLWQEVADRRLSTGTPLINYLGCDSDELDEKHPSLPDSNASKSETSLLFLEKRETEIIALSGKDLFERNDIHNNGVPTKIVTDSCNDCAHLQSKLVSHRKSI